MKAWFVPPLVIPIFVVLMVVAFAAHHAFQARNSIQGLIMGSHTIRSRSGSGERSIFGAMILQPVAPELRSAQLPFGTA